MERQEIVERQEIKGAPLSDATVAKIRSGLTSAGPGELRAQVEALLADREDLLAEARRNFRWSYQLLLALARRVLKDHQNNKGEWPGDMTWQQLVPSSREVFLRLAREEAGVPHDTYLRDIHDGSYDVDDLYDQAAGDA